MHLFPQCFPIVFFHQCDKISVYMEQIVNGSVEYLLSVRKLKHFLGCCSLSNRSVAVEDQTARLCTV